jgi:hypothetical protein
VKKLMPNKINNFSSFKNLSKGTFGSSGSLNPNPSLQMAGSSPSKWDVNKTVLKSEMHRLESLKVMSLKGRTLLPELKGPVIQRGTIGTANQDRFGEEQSSMYDNGQRETRDRKRREDSEWMLKVINKQEETRQQRNTLTNIISIYK